MPLNLLSRLPRFFFLGVATLLVIFLISFVSKKFYEDTENNPVLIRKGAELLKQSAEWTFSSQQTNNPLLALTHANYATAYLNLARNLASDADLTDFTKIPVKDVREDAEKAVRDARERIISLCPQSGDANRSAAHVGYYAPTVVKSRPAVVATATQNYQQTAQNYQQTAQNYQQTAQNYPQTAQNYPQTAQNYQQTSLPENNGGFGPLMGGDPMRIPVPSYSL